MHKLLAKTTFAIIVFLTSKIIDLPASVHNCPFRCQNVTSKCHCQTSFNCRLVLNAELQMRRIKYKIVIFIALAHLPHIRNM